MGPGANKRPACTCSGTGVVVGVIVGVDDPDSLTVDVAEGLAPRDSDGVGDAVCDGVMLLDGDGESDTVGVRDAVRVDERVIDGDSPTVALPLGVTVGNNDPLCDGVAVALVLGDAATATEDSCAVTSPATRRATPINNMHNAMGRAAQCTRHACPGASG